MSTEKDADYDVQIDRAAEKDLDRLPKQAFEAVDRKILQLGTTPRPNGAIKLKNDIYRVRVGDYRIIYVIIDPEKRVIISRVKARNERTYRDL